MFATGCKSTVSNLNLSFEEIQNGMPRNWYIYHEESGYKVYSDSENVKSGKYSIAIEYLGDSNYKYQMVCLDLPNNYKGESITLSGYIKTENVIEGYAGLFIRIDPGIAYNEMVYEVTGTTDWKKYEITLDLRPAQTQKIIIGGLLAGKGKIWLDDLKITVDGNDIRKARLYKTKSIPDKSESEFDKRSDIIFPEITEQKIEDLELLGRIWGLMKYHHPVIARGNYDWDSELFRILPSYLNVKEPHQRDKFLIHWIKKFGKIPKCKRCQATSDNAVLKPDLSWIESSDISSTLKDLLHEIYFNRNIGYQHYIYFYLQPMFRNEKKYESMEHPDAGFQLLALYRYWNMINYFFPYKHLTDKDWNTVLREYIQFFIDAKNKREYELIVTLLIGEVCDSHAYIDKEENINPLLILNSPGNVLVRLKFIEDKLVVIENYIDENELSEYNGLKRGDVITHIEGIPVEQLVDSMLRYFPGSNKAARLRDICREILRSKKNTILIDYLSRDNKKIQKKISVGTRLEWMYHRYQKEREVYSRVREIIPKSYEIIDNDIGFINIDRIKNADMPVIKTEFVNTKGIIIDFRNYPPIDLYPLISYFLSKDTSYVKFTKGNHNNPGEFTFQSENRINKPKETYQGKLVVIVDEETQSAAETYTMAFRAGKNTTIIGSPTAGANGNITSIFLPGGLKTQFSGIGVYYPDGRETQRIGIIPDIEIKPTIKGIREGRDELLEMAIEIIKNE